MRDIAEEQAAEAHQAFMESQQQEPEAVFKELNANQHIELFHITADRKKRRDIVAGKYLPVSTVNTVTGYGIGRLMPKGVRDPKKAIGAWTSSKKIGDQIADRIIEGIYFDRVVGPKGEVIKSTPVYCFVYTLAPVVTTQPAVPEKKKRGRPKKVKEGENAGS